MHIENQNDQKQTQMKTNFEHLIQRTLILFSKFMFIIVIICAT